MTTNQHVSVAKTHTIMAHATMWQGLRLSRHIRLCLPHFCVWGAKYPVVGAGGDRSL